MSSVTTQIAKLKCRENFDTWVISARSYLTIKGLWKCTQTSLASSATEAQKEVYDKAFSELTLLIDPSCYSYITGQADIKSAWEALNKAFADGEVCREVSLLQQLVSTKLNDCNSMEDYVDNK